MHPRGGASAARGCGGGAEADAVARSSCRPQRLCWSCCSAGGGAAGRASCCCWRCRAICSARWSLLAVARLRARALLSTCKAAAAAEPMSLSLSLSLSLCVCVCVCVRRVDRSREIVAMAIAAGRPLWSARHWDTSRSVGAHGFGYKMRRLATESNRKSNGETVTTTGPRSCVHRSAPIRVGCRRRCIRQRAPMPLNVKRHLVVEMLREGSWHVEQPRA